MWCLKVTEAENCNFKSINGVHTTKLVRNDILHLIVGFLVEIDIFNMDAGGHLGFWPFTSKRDTGFMGTFRRAIYGYLGMLVPNFSSDTYIFTPNSKMTGPLGKNNITLCRSTQLLY